MKRLYLSDKDRKIAGVCGGLSEIFDVDPVIFRIIFLVASFVGGLGILAYLIFWVATPKKPKRVS